MRYDHATMNELKPTIWRTCRALASTNRLDLIRILLAKPHPRTVADIASHTPLADNAASQQLRILNARGLISSRRDGRYVFYSAEANPNVADAPEILASLKHAIRNGQTNDEIIAQCTAYTHERRVRLIQALQERPSTSAELSVIAHISAPSVRRHLLKLERRGLVEHGRDRYSIRTPTSSFAATLFFTALNQKVS